MSWIQTQINLLDAQGSPQPFIAYTDGTKYSFAHPLLDVNGAIIDPAVRTPSTHLSKAITNSLSAYSTGMNVGGLLTLSGATRVNSGSGVIQAVNVVVKTAITAPYNVVFFDTAPTSTISDNATFNLNQVTDIGSVVGLVRCTDSLSLGAPQLLQATNVGLPFKLTAGDTNLYAAIVTAGAPTYATTSALELNVFFLQD